MAIYKGNIVNTYWSAYCDIETTSYADKVEVVLKSGLYNNKDYGSTAWSNKITATNKGTVDSASSTSVRVGRTKGSYNQKTSGTIEYTRGTDSYDITINYEFKTVGGTVAPGTSSGSKTITIPPLAKYSITYNSNGGEGSISKQDKYYGQSISLSNGSGFIRPNYEFLGWNTKADGTGTGYSPESTYSENSDVILYAQWKLTYIKPSISNAKAYRVNSGGAPDMQGEYIYVSFNYKGGSIDGGSTYIKSTCVIKINDTTKLSAELPNTTGVHTITYGTYSVNDTHTVSIQLYDSTGGEAQGATRTLQIPSLVAPIDILGDSVNNKVYVGIGGVAIQGQSGFQCRISAAFYDSLQIQDTELEALLTNLGWTDCIE